MSTVIVEFFKLNYLRLQVLIYKYFRCPPEQRDIFATLRQDYRTGLADALFKGMDEPLTGQAEAYYYGFNNGKVQEADACKQAAHGEVKVFLDGLHGKSFDLTPSVENFSMKKRAWQNGKNFRRLMMREFKVD
jgi:hypothetical protein